MKILSEASFKRLIAPDLSAQRRFDTLVADNTRQFQEIGRLQRERTDYEQKIYEAQNEGATIKATNARLAARVRSADARVQELTLLCGIKGYAVEMTPDTPAVPAKPGVLVLTKISKGT